LTPEQADTDQSAAATYERLYDHSLTSYKSAVNSFRRVKPPASPTGRTGNRPRRSRDDRTRTCVRTRALAAASPCTERDA